MSNPPRIDTAAYTFDTSITPSMYEQLLHQHVKTGITLILAKYNISLRTRNKHNIFYAFPNEDSKTAKDYIIVLDGVEMYSFRSLNVQYETRRVWNHMEQECNGIRIL